MFALCLQAYILCLILSFVWFRETEATISSLPAINEVRQIESTARDSQHLFYLRDEIFAQLNASHVLHRVMDARGPSLVHNFSLPLASRMPTFPVKSITGTTQDDLQQVVSEADNDGRRHLRRIPDTTDKQSILSFARMAANAYIEDESSDKWLEIDGAWNRSLGIGWDSDGVRGHVFADTSGSVVVISLKGTTTLLGTNGDDTHRNDKTNDNLLFSCCCGRVNFAWSTVCDCYAETYTCSQTCLERELISRDTYYEASLRVFRDVTELYPNSSIWLTGHSLGASLCSLVAQTYGVPAVLFGAPGEKLAASRLHLPSWLHPHSERYIWHFGNTADPVFMGTCNGPLSVCAIAGYAMESQCHSGLECIYDTVAEKDYEMSIFYHQIAKMIEIVEEYDVPAACSQPMSCQDCYLWNFIRD
ncbi:Alpha/Beta hydrolase protein [Lipomyces kononenkoae]|uniref:Alpha/Beta hydrolase protein n=1 Tax=Lipomyces kononenkoae TaxID=34357 RepID=A0ACC3T7G3_LIPKO